MKKRLRYWPRLGRLWIRRSGSGGGALIGMLILVIGIPINVVHDLTRGLSAAEVVHGSIGHVALMCAALVIFALTAVEMDYARGARRRASWFRVESYRKIEEGYARCNARLTQQKLGAEEYLRAAIAKARREIEQERRKDGEGWKRS